MTPPKERLGVALAGCGRFGDFCLSAAGDLPQLLPAGVTDTDRARALATAGRHGIAAHPDYAALLGDDRVDVVIIATPPADHAPMALAAIAAGKHVFCEKPLATSLPEATAVVQAASAHRVRLSVDYVLRWNPLYRLLRRLQGLSTPAGAPLLGRLRHFAFHNLARDDHLPPDHWFWDPKTSGGIFVEHGVHFFDAAAWLLGSHPLEVQALEVARGGEGPVDTAIATALHPGGATATYTHVFARPEPAEYQETMLDWGFARAVVSGWIPVELQLEAWTDPDGAALLLDLDGRADELLEVPGFRRSSKEQIAVEVVQAYGKPPPWRGGGETRPVSHRMRLRATLGGAAAKQHVYRESVRAGIADLLAAVRTDREPLLTARDAWESLATAVAARQAAASGRQVAPPAFPGPPEPSSQPDRSPTSPCP
jgi:predicted dehydrogenase